MIGRSGTIVAVVCLGVMAASTASAQRSVIRGLVLDPDGAPVAEATVRAESPTSVRTVETETNESGRFAFIGLQRGQWLFSVQKPGFEPTQSFAPVRRTGSSGLITMRMEFDVLNPPPPSHGHLAGLRADDVQTSVDTAHELFDTGDYDGAISAYEAVLEQVPTLTSLNLQIGHAYREKRDYSSAEAAYQRVPRDSEAGTEAQSAMQELEALTDSSR